MEEDQKTEGVTQEQVPQEAPREEVKSDQSVNFSSLPVRSAKPKSSAKTFLGIFILIIFVVGGFLIFKDSNKNNIAEETPAPEEQFVTESTPEATPVPVDKSKVAVEIQNGTGISGEAAYLRDALKALGYSDFKLGNAATSDNVTTTVTYKSTVAQSVQDEVSEKLNALYKEVTVKSSTTQVSDVVVITGLQKGATAKPAATATATAKPAASTSPSPSSSPTASPNATPQ